jgi:hypothetical protein
VVGVPELIQSNGQDQGREMDSKLIAETTDSRILEETNSNENKFEEPTFSYDFEFVNGFKMSKKVMD